MSNKKHVLNNFRSYFEFVHRHYRKYLVLDGVSRTPDCYGRSLASSEAH